MQDFQNKFSVDFSSASKFIGPFCAISNRRVLITQIQLRRVRVSHKYTETYLKSPSFVHFRKNLKRFKANIDIAAPTNCASNIYFFVVIVSLETLFTSLTFPHRGRRTREGNHETMGKRGIITCYNKRGIITGSKKNRGNNYNK